MFDSVTFVLVGLGIDFVVWVCGAVSFGWFMVASVLGCWFIVGRSVCAGFVMLLLVVFWWFGI